MAFCYNLLQFGIVCCHLVYFSHFGVFGPRKIWQPCPWSREVIEKYDMYVCKSFRTKKKIGTFDRSAFYTSAQSK
jgi:hypothetical protein